MLNTDLLGIGKLLQQFDDSVDSKRWVLKKSLLFVIFDSTPSLAGPIYSFHLES